MIAELWKPIPRFGGYEASNMGRIRSLDRRIAHARYGTVSVRGRVLAFHLDKDGYCRISISIGGESTYQGVHRLVAAAWIGECPDGWEVNHRNGVKSDNSSENLEYVTPSENTLHALNVLGTFPHGDSHGRAKLSSSDIPLIRDKIASGEPLSVIARQFGVCQATISNVKSGLRWGGR